MSGRIRLCIWELLPVVSKYFRFPLNKDSLIFTSIFIEYEIARINLGNDKARFFPFDLILEVLHFSCLLVDLSSPSRWNSYYRLYISLYLWRFTSNLIIVILWYKYHWALWIFRCLYNGYHRRQEHKIRCIIHYFERICSNMPVGFVSFERKVLPLEHLPLCISYPKDRFWCDSVIPLCQFEVTTGLIFE